MGLERHRKSDVWYLRIQIEGKPYYRSTGKKDKREAREVVASIEKELREEIAARETPQWPTVAEWWEEYRKQYTPRKRAQKRDVYSIARALKKWGPKRLDEVTQAETVQYANERATQGAAEGTIRREIGFLQGFWNRAIEDKRATTNPFKWPRTLTKPRDRARNRVLSPADQAQLLPHLRDDYRRLLIVLVGSGLREAELLALRPADVHHGFIHVSEEAAKFAKPRRVPLRKEVDEALEAQRQGEGPYWTQDPSTLRQTIMDACVRVKIPHTTIHDLRRTFASRCAIAGVPPKVLQEWLGHHSIEVTMKYYAHVGDVDSTRIMDGLDLGLGKKGKVVAFQR
jgi:integrase